MPTTHYNLANAKNKILAFKHKYPNLDKTTETFLQKVEDHINSIENRVRTDTLDNLNIDTCYNEDASIIAKRFNDNTETARDNCRDSTQELKAFVEREEVKIIDGTDFAKLLIEIKEDCDGIIEGLKTNGSLKAAHIYRFCQQLGGFFIPSSQGSDPLMGMEKDKTGEWKANEGECHGLVKDNERQIETLGNVVEYPRVKNNVNEYQEHQQPAILRTLVGVKAYLKKQATLSLDKKNSISDFLTGALANLESDTFYYLDFYEASKAGHAMQLRLLHSTYVEFYDPNFGRFYFKNKDDFKEFYTFLVLYYVLNFGMNISILRFIQTSKIHPEFLTEILPGKFQKKSQYGFNDDNIIQILKELTNVIHLSVLQNPYQISDEKLLILLHDTINLFLKYVSSQKTLSEIQGFLEYLRLYFLAFNQTKLDEILKPLEDKLEILKLTVEQPIKKDTSSKSEVSEIEVRNTSSNTKNAKKDIQISVSEPKLFIGGAHVMFKSKAEDRVIYPVHDVKILIEDFIKTIEVNYAEKDRPEILEPLLKDFKNDKKLFNNKIELEVVIEYLKELSDKLSANQKILSDDSDPLLKTILTTMLQNVNDYHAKILKIPMMLNTALAKLSKEGRISAHQKFLQEKILDNLGIKLWGPFEALSIGNLAQIKKLREIVNKNYDNYYTLEQEVHTIYRNLVFGGDSLLKNLLGTFFTDHLQLSTYNSKKPKLTYYEFDEDVQENKLSKSQVTRGATLKSSYSPFNKR